MAAGKPTGGRTGQKSNKTSKRTETPGNTIPESIPLKKEDPMEGRTYKTMSEICVRVGRTVNTVVNWVVHRKFPAYRYGATWHAEERDIRRWEEMQKKGNIDEFEWNPPSVKGGK